MKIISCRPFFVVWIFSAIGFLSIICQDPICAQDENIDRYFRPPKEEPTPPPASETIMPEKSRARQTRATRKTAAKKTRPRPTDPAKPTTSSVDTKNKPALPSKTAATSPSPALLADKAASAISKVPAATPPPKARRSRKRPAPGDTMVRGIQEPLFPLLDSERSATPPQSPKAWTRESVELKPNPIAGDSLWAAITPAAAETVAPTSAPTISEPAPPAREVTVSDPATSTTEHAVAESSASSAEAVASEIVTTITERTAAEPLPAASTEPVASEAPTLATAPDVSEQGSSDRDAAEQRDASETASPTALPVAAEPLPPTDVPEIHEPSLVTISTPPPSHSPAAAALPLAPPMAGKEPRQDPPSPAPVVSRRAETPWTSATQTGTRSAVEANYNLRAIASTEPEALRHPVDRDFVYQITMGWNGKPDEVRIRIPEPLELLNLQRIDGPEKRTRRLATGETLVTWKYAMRPISEGDASIGPVAVTATTRSGQSLPQVEIPRHAVVIGPREAGWFGSILLGSFVAAAAAIAAWGGAIFASMRRRKQYQEAARDSLPSWEERLLCELDTLQVSLLRGNVHGYYGKLSYLTQQMLRARNLLDRIDMSAPEIIETLRAAGVDPIFVESVESLLLRCEAGCLATIKPDESAQEKIVGELKALMRMRLRPSEPRERPPTP